MSLPPATQRPQPRCAPPAGSPKYTAILETAEAMFGAHGFRKASVEEIAAQAGVSKPLIYRYFRSKKHLFEVVVDRVIDEWCDVIAAEGARATPSAAHSLRLIVRASLEFARSRDVLRGLLARESQLMLAGYSDVLDRGTDTLRRVVAEALERGVRGGDVRTDLDLDNMAGVITEVCVRFGERLLAGDMNAGQTELLEAIVETLLHGVIVHREANGPT
ncbi:MAG: TetR/AcrR family transcriptional regulator [Deltaproteobacteria bacterium]|nr:TetR/AcrR family transcriptional regulator [Deltaproteobacteria bacterium]MBW2361209.1 TetR/AcrR family transcriptional regulator [Deltaproteobacteria bacterium]